MSISGIGSYTPYYTSSTAAKTAVKGENAEDATQTKSTASSTTANNTTSKSTTAAEYNEYLQEKFSYLNKSTSMEGVPTTVSVSSAFIRKCANDPEKAKYLEENLAALPRCAAYATSHAQGTLTSLAYQIDADGNITGISSGTNDPDGKIAKENAERKARESKEKAEKLEEKRAAKRAEEKKLEEKRAAKKTELVVALQEQLTDKMKTSTAAGGEQWSVSVTSAPESQTINSGGNFNSYV